MVALLETLKNAMRDFAAREDKLNSDFRSRSAVETRAFDTAKTKRTTELEEESAKVEANYNSAKDQAVARFEQRKASVDHVESAGR